MVALLQLIVTSTSQEAQHGGFARLYARPRRVSFRSEVPELLEYAVVVQKGSQQLVVIRGEQSGKTVGLSGTVQQHPFGVLLWTSWELWTVIGLCEVEHVGFVVEHQPRAALVIPIDVVNTVA